QVVKTPYAFGVIEVEDEDGEAQRLGMDIVHRVTQAVSEPFPSIQKLFSFIDSLWQPKIQTLLLCVPMENSMTVILRGSGVVYLKRDGHIARLRSSEGTISGAIHPKDILFLSSKTCLTGVSEEEFFSFFDHQDAPDIAEKLALHLHQKNDNVGYAGLFVEVRGGEVKTRGEDFESPETYKEEQLPSIQKQSRLKIRLFFRSLRTMDIRITGVLLLLFVVCIGIGIIRERSGRKTTEVTKTIEEGQHLYDEGVALLDLNLVKSRERLVAAKQLVEKSKQTVSPKTKEGRMLGELDKKIGEALPKATKEYEATPELFFDVSLLKTGSSISTFSFYEDTMVFLDTNNKTVFTLQLSSKNGQIVAGGGTLDGSQYVAIHGDRVYVFTSEGIHVVNLSDKSIKPLVIKKAADWISIKAMTAFGGNIYLLDSGKGRIWKYVATASAFSDTREYLNPDFFPDLSKTTNLTIDGSVWLGTTTGSVIRFTQGKDDVFIPKGVDPAFGNTIMVFTDDNCTNVYILDSENHRVVVLEKDGMYTSQYTYPQTFITKGIAASEKLGKLFLFSDGKLYTVSLK
ncbi:hypothetical protein MUP56_02250, partial [Patescibacteria group bacterium]|nr:hypothetical protein [Patescibacteria group bacterium]